MNKGYKAMCEMAKLDMRRAALISREQTLDKVTLTLGKFGFSHDDFRKFRDLYQEVEKEFCEEIVSDGKDDKEMIYSKYSIDRALKQYVPEDMFVPYEQRYNY